jgi:hypothetical protein
MILIDRFVHGCMIGVLIVHCKRVSWSAVKALNGIV